ncbi:ubiquitin-like-specific protease ESD4 [Dioscorea cayenensis subsp. rotundata]|uniref:Ubiquitin-like-specific protease ESD4 n=1 Tax=Dioscorea cayennensis subsp. rotundata TaxID=55577 RepID=A0AB40BJJ9_DIOCR|nr:ubiquitin-like-specific protease ESD4 [Dioscorea cayenensis subsp. rotundata]
MGGYCSTFAKPFQWNDNQSHENLGLEDYKRMVSGHEAVGKLSSLPRQFSPPVSDLTVLTREEDDEKPKSVVLNRKVKDVRKVGLEVTPQFVRNWVPRKEPLYKELYEASARKYDGKLSSLELEVKITESKLSGIRFSRPEKKPTKDLQEVFAPITDEEDSLVYDALHCGSGNEIIVTHEGANITITREILQCLSSGAWLNDEVINVYFELLKERERREPKKFLTCHFFNTFFYKKLISGRNGYDYKAVRRWTSQRKIGYSLVECDKIFVPIHKEVHWCLAVINVKDEKLQYLDSLGGMDINVLRVLAKYFMDEAKDKSDKQVDTTSWTQEMVESLPQQQNGSDCGMFMLKYADFYSRGLDLCFRQGHMDYFRKRTALEILRLKAN